MPDKNAAPTTSRASEDLPSDAASPIKRDGLAPNVFMVPPRVLSATAPNTLRCTRIPRRVKLFDESPWNRASIPLRVAVADQANVQSHVVDEIERAAPCRLYPFTVVAENAAADAGQEHDVRARPLRIERGG